VPEFRDVTKFAFKFDNARTSNVFSRSKFVELLHVPVMEFKFEAYTISNALHVYTGTANVHCLKSERIENTTRGLLCRHVSRVRNGLCFGF